jgi:hypothetical protein
VEFTNILQPVITWVLKAYDQLRVSKYDKMLKMIVQVDLSNEPGVTISSSTLLCRQSKGACVRYALRLVSVSVQMPICRWKFFSSSKKHQTSHPSDYSLLCRERARRGGAAYSFSAKYLKSWTASTFSIFYQPRMSYPICTKTMYLHYLANVLLSAIREEKGCL